MQNRKGTSAEMKFHNKNKIRCLQESIIRHLFGVTTKITKGELKNVFIHQHGSSFRKQILNGAVKGRNCKHRVITLFQSFSIGEKKWPLQAFWFYQLHTNNSPWMYHPDQIAVWKTVLLWWLRNPRGLFFHGLIT